MFDEFVKKIRNLKFIFQPNYFSVKNLNQDFGISSLNLLPALRNF